MKTRFLVAALALYPSLTAAHAGTPYSVDDPGTTEIEHTTVSVNYFSTQIRGSESQSAPNITITHGQTPNLELDLLTGLATARTSGTDRQTGFGDTTLGVRWRFAEETRRAPQVAMAYFLKIPTASTTHGLGTGKVDHLLYLMSAKSYGKAYVFGDAGYNILGAAGQKNNAIYGLAVTYQTTEKLNLGAQVYGNTTPAAGVPGELAFGVGLTDNYAANQALLVAASHSTRGLSDLNLYAGMALLHKCCKRQKSDRMLVWLHLKPTLTLIAIFVRKIAICHLKLIYATTPAGITWTLGPTPKPAPTPAPPTAATPAKPA